MVEEKEESIWGRKIYLLWRRRRTEKEKEENMWRRKSLSGREGGGVLHVNRGGSLYTVRPRKLTNT